MVDRVVRVVGAGLLLSLAVAAWHDVSKAWDVWYYHLPFAARVVGLTDAASFTFARSNQARFDGFPLLGELIQGLLWRATGRPECANFFALAALPAFAWFLKRFFSVPPHLAVVAFLAIPLVQIHATAGYVDFTSNALVTMLGLLAYRQVVRREAPTRRTLVLGSLLAIAAANTKFQLVPVVLVGYVAFVFQARARSPKRGQRLAMIAIALPLIFATPIKNTIVHGNPVWPIEFHLFGASLPYVEHAYASTPQWLERFPRPIRWAASVLELGLQPIASHHRWSVDQWTPPSDPGYRMGGFFSGYVVVTVLALAVGAFLRRTREANVALGFAVGATLLASFMPQSHELRYYLFWMLLLVSLNLVVWSSAINVVPRGHARQRGITFMALVSGGALVIVGWSTRGTYLYASGTSFTDLLASQVDRSSLDPIPEGERVCVARQPWTFLYAARFHPGRAYRVQEAESPEDCAGARDLDTFPPIHH